MTKTGNVQRVRVQNRYIIAEYTTINEAAKSLSLIGNMTEDKIRKLLLKRVGYINGFVVTYPGSHRKED